VSRIGEGPSISESYSLPVSDEKMQEKAYKVAKRVAE